MFGQIDRTYGTSQDQPRGNLQLNVFHLTAAHIQVWIPSLGISGAGKPAPTFKWPEKPLTARTYGPDATL